MRTIGSSTGYIASDTTDLEQFSSNMPSSLEANGFFVKGSGGRTNTNNENYVSWVWKAGGDAVTGTGSGVTNVSVSANTAAGFSIVKYTGGNSASDTVNHGLTDAEMIILKDLDDNHNWRAWHKDLTANHWLYLNLPNAQASAAVDGGIRNVDSNSFGFINGTTQGVQAVNNSSNNYIAYVWKSISDYSKIGTYEGNGTTRNVDLGFDPSWIMIKNADTGSTAWNIVDTRRDTDTTLNLFLQANTNVIEGNTTICSLITDGFSVTGTNTFNNSSNDTFIYMAFK